ncbi:hypothetical protein [Mangrovicoccus sp. HB161399]|nr:hypothetical protein [Mangrovicoccus sp. HB161399]
MPTVLETLKTRITSTFCADLAGMAALSVIVLGCLHLPTFL